MLERESEAGKTNSRNGYRQRSLSLEGLGERGLRVPRNRQSHYRSQPLPFRKRRTMELESMAAEMFLAGHTVSDGSGGERAMR